MSPTPLTWPTMLRNAWRRVVSMSRHQRGRLMICNAALSVGLGGALRPLRISLWRWPRICRSRVSISALQPASLARSIRRPMKSRSFIT